MDAPSFIDPLDPRSGEYPVEPGGRPSRTRWLERPTLPPPRALLTGMVVVRLILMALTVGRELGVQHGGVDAEVGAIAAIAGIALIASAWLAWFLVRYPSVVPSANAILVQAAVDVLVVTLLLQFEMTSGAAALGPRQVAATDDATSVAALYLAIVTVYALLLPVRRGLGAVGLAIACYIGITVRATHSIPDRTFWIQVAVIGFVGALIAMLGNRLTAASREQSGLEAELLRARLEADEILGSIQSGVMSVDGTGRLGYINPRGRRILSADSASFVPGQPVMEALRSRSREMYDAITQGMSSGARVSRAEAQVRRADGSLFPVGLSTTAFERPGTRRRLVTAIFTDISDLKRLQEFRLRAERLEAVAALSASLAHEIRNPLAAIRSAVEQLVRLVGPGDDEQTLSRLVVRESARLNRLLSEFLDFSRVRVAKFERLELMELVHDAARTVRQHPAAEAVTIEVIGEEVELDADVDLLNRIVSNLILNAAQAMEGRGRIEVHVGRSSRSEVAASAVERSVKLQVRDEGPGIPAEVRERLFEPFVTGRPGGTGLGLAIVSRAVAAHRGIMSFESSPAGTTFSIFLPATWNREDRA